jgi:DNA replication protein DnaC
MSDLQRQQGTSGVAQSTKEQKPKLFYNNPQDLVKIVEGNGFNREVAGDDFISLCNAASRAFSITTPRRVGLIVTGDYGCGKTFFIECLRVPNSQFIDLTLAETVEWLDQRGGYQTSLDEICNGNVILDDLGAESIKNEYGVKRDIVGEFICRYHSKGKGRLFITTNLRGPELLDRYGGRVVDRLKQLCVPFHMNGKSKRKWL